MDTDNRHRGRVESLDICVHLWFNSHASTVSPSISATIVSISDRVHLWGHSYNDSLPFEFGMFEVDDQTDTEFGDLQVIDHLSYLVVADLLDDLCVDNDGIESYEIGDLFTNIEGLVDDRITWLLKIRNALLSELNGHSVLVRLFQQPMPQRVEYLERTSDDAVRFFFEQKLVSHRFAPWVKEV